MRWLVPRIGDAESAAAARLRAEGNEVVEVTVGRIVRLPVVLPPCDWLVVTSRHAVRALAGLRRTGRPSPPEGALAVGPRVAVVGPATAAAAAAAGVERQMVTAERPGSNERFGNTENERKKI